MESYGQTRYDCDWFHFRIPISRAMVNLATHFSLWNSQLRAPKVHHLLVVSTCFIGDELGTNSWFNHQQQMVKPLAFGGGFKHCLCPPGIWDVWLGNWYFLEGLKPLTSQSPGMDLFYPFFQWVSFVLIRLEVSKIVFWYLHISSENHPVIDEEIVTVIHSVGFRACVLQACQATFLMFDRFSCSACCELSIRGRSWGNILV